MSFSVVHDKAETLVLFLLCLDVLFKRGQFHVALRYLPWLLSCLPRPLVFGSQFHTPFINKHVRESFQFSKPKCVLYQNIFYRVFTFHCKKFPLCCFLELLRETVAMRMHNDCVSRRTQTTNEFKRGLWYWLLVCRVFVVRRQMFFSEKAEGGEANSRVGNFHAEDKLSLQRRHFSIVSLTIYILDNIKNRSIDLQLHITYLLSHPC